MMHRSTTIAAPLLLTATLATGCATLDGLVSPPGVSLRNVHVESLDMDRQRFLLSFDVTNPNPFPLPVREVRYAVSLDGHRFASGRAGSSFSVPAGSDTEFAISVDLDLLETAPQLLFIVRDGIYRDIPYALEGQFGVDIPHAPPLAFVADGVIRLQANAH